MSHALIQSITDESLSAWESYVRARTILAQANGFRLDASRALRLLHRSISLSPTALPFFKLGQLYSGTWRGVTVNNELALEYFRRAGTLGCTEMRVEITRILSNAPFGSEEHKYETLRMLQSAATNECPESLFVLAHILAQQKNKVLNSLDSGTMAFLKGALLLGHVEALFCLSETLRKQAGQDNTSDFEEAVRCFECGVENGLARCPCKPGNFCCEATLKNEPDSAVSYYRSAAQKNSFYAMHYLGKIIIRGDFGTEPNETEGMTWLERAAASGGGFHKYWLALTITKRKDGPGKDLHRVLKLFREAMSDGNLSAHVELGRILLYGLYDIESDKDEGISLLEHAVEHGEKEAMLALGRFFISRDSEAVGAEVSRGVEILEKAIDLGEPRAAYYLGMFFLDGALPNFRPDINRALELMELAASFGFDVAMAQLGSLYLRGEDRGVDRNVVKGINYHRQAIDKGNVVSMNYLALLFLHGTPEVEQDLTAAIDLFFRALDMGDGYAAYRLALIYHFGQTVEEDLPRAVQLYKKAVEFGDENSILPLASLLSIGKHGIERDMKTAVQLYERAAQAGESVAEYVLACIYQRGEPDLGIEKNMDHAITLYRSACEKGLTLAQTRLGTILYNADSDCESDVEDEAAALLEAAADAGCTEAMHQLAILWEYKETDPTHMERAVHLYKEAAKLGNVDAIIDIAEMYLTGNFFQKDSRLFVEYLEEGIKLGSLEAMNRLAKFLRHGDSQMARDVNRAVQLLYTAMNAGHAPARDMLADIFFHGEGELKRDVLEALRLYREGIDEQCASSMFELATLLRQGVAGYLKKDVREAFELFRRAGEQGHIEALRIAGNMLFEGAEGIERDTKAAVELYLKSIEEQDVEAMYALGIIYELGSDELPRDLNKATQWYKEAIMNGHTEALVRLSSLALTKSN